MTVIVGVESPKGTVVLGGDSAAVGADMAIPFTQPKVFKVGPYVMGFAGSWRMGQILRYAFQPPIPPKEVETDDQLHAFMANRFIPRFINVLDEQGYHFEDHSMKGCNVMVGIQGCLFEVGEDFSIGSSHLGYTAVGCANEIAFGALHATQGQQPINRVYAALEAASEFSINVIPPFVVVEA